jgi:YidC/Oxa1 family membrane protein insertase
MLATIWNTIILYPMYNIIALLYHYLGNNLGWAILAIAIISRLVMIPLVKKQTDMTKKMGTLKPELEKLQKEYANNKEKLAEEQMKLYKKVGYNPLGCLGTFIPQLVILTALISVIRAVTSNHFDGLYEWVLDIVNVNGKFVVDTNFFIWDLTKNYNDVAKETSRFSSEALPYLGLAISVGIVQFVSSLFTQKLQTGTVKKKKKKGEVEALAPEEMQTQMMNSMLYLFPIMTILFSLG